MTCQLCPSNSVKVLFRLTLKLKVLFNVLLFYCIHKEIKCEIVLHLYFDIKMICFAFPTERHNIYAAAVWKMAQH